MKSLLPLAALLAAAAALGACSDREETPATPSATFTGTATRTATAAPTPTATLTPGGDLARRLATGPEYFIYAVAEGDTIASIADMFDGVVGERDRQFEEELRTLNELTPGARLTPGHELAIPLRLPAMTSLFQDNSLSEALRKDAVLTTPPLLVPGIELRDALGGRVALARVEIAARPARGFILTFAGTDRVAVKAGELDRSARYTSPLFIVAGGSLGEALLREHPDAFEHRDGGYTYRVAVLDASAPEAAAIAAGLVPSLP